MNREPLESTHLPDEGRIAGRDEEVSQFANLVDPDTGQSPSNMLSYGKTGTGKSLCATYVSRRLTRTADRHSGPRTGRDRPLPETLRWVEPVES